MKNPAAYATCPGFAFRKIGNISNDRNPKTIINIKSENLDYFSTWILFSTWITFSQKTVDFELRLAVLTFKDFQPKLFLICS